MTVPVAAQITKSGKLARFFPMSGTASASGYYAPQPVTAVASNPTISRNGTAIAVGPATWTTNNGIPYVDYLLQCGSVQTVAVANGGTTAYAAPTIAASGGGGTGLTFGAVTLDAGIIAYAVTPSTGWTSAPSVAMTGGTYTTPPSATVVLAGGTLTIVPTVGGALGCGTGVTVKPTFTLSGGSQAGTVATTLGNYVKSVAVTAGGSGYTSMPTITASDSTGAGASLLPVMSGVLASDTMTYSASASWLSCAAGNAPSASGAAIANSTGVLEGAAGTLAGYPSTRTMRLGVNPGGYPTDSTSLRTITRNYANVLAHTWNISGGGALTVDARGEPVSWTSPGASTVYARVTDSTGIANPVDSRGVPIQMGAWTLIYDDPGVGTASAMTVYLTVSGQATAVAGTSVVSGTTITTPYVVSYNSLAGALGVYLQFNIQDPGSAGTWRIANLQIIAPNNVPVRGTQYQVDDNITRWLVSPAGNTPACIRWMDAIFDPSINCNIVDFADCPDPDDFNWGQPYALPSAPGTTDARGNTVRSGMVQWHYYRCYNTDPAKGPAGDGTYGWVSPRLYSNLIGVSGTDAFGAYLSMPASDDGTFLGLSSPTTSCAIELVSDAPHGIKSTQVAQFNQFHLSITLAGSAGSVDLYNQEPFFWVTGPNSVVFTLPCNSTGGGIGRVAGAAQTSCTGLITTIFSPSGPSTSYQAAARTCSQLGADLWINIGAGTTNACSASIAQAVAANLTPGLRVYVEYINEHWNGGQPVAGELMPTLALLASYAPVGTPIGPYYATTGVGLGNDAYYTFQSSNHHAIWTGVFAALGRAGSIVKVFGTQFSNSGVLSAMIATATTYGVPMDQVASAVYTGSAGGALVQAAYAPAGAAGFTAGNWPVDAMADRVKGDIYYCELYWGYFAANLACVRQYGQPTVATGYALVAAAGATLVTGFTHVYYTYVSAAGETTVAGSDSGYFYVNSGYKIVATLPALPYWATSFNVYIQNSTETQSSQAQLALNVVPAPGATSTTVSLSAAPTSAVNPPQSNTAQLGNGPPGLIGYEGASLGLGAGEPFEGAHARDLFHHPTYADIQYVLWLSMQTGDPRVTGSGLTMACHFVMSYAWPSDGNIFALAIGTSQAAGAGTGNLYSTPQGGAPGDNLCHDVNNAAVGIRAYQLWVDATGTPAAQAVYIATGYGTTGYAASATIAPYTNAGGASTAALNCAVGTIVEDSAAPGIYRTTISYPAYLLPAGTIPAAVYTINGARTAAVMAPASPSASPANLAL